MNELLQIRQPILSDFRAYEEVLAATFRSDNPLLHNVLEYIHSKRGKQIRPTLVLLSAAICRGITSKTLDTAAALELMHTATLVHDDVVDDSPLRRGNDAIHTHWTNQIAVLVGDYILSHIIGILSDIRNNTILSIVAEMGKALADGELLQLHSGQSMWISEKQYMQVIEHKTACLFSACAAAGAVSSGATNRQITALKQFGLNLGLCFQLQDDVFDYSDIEELGKPTMHDIRDGKATLPIIISLARAPKEEANTIRLIAEDLATHSSVEHIVDAEQSIKSFVLRYEGVRYVHQVMMKHRKKAIEALNIFPDCAAKDSLIQLLDYAINRVY